MSEPRYTTGKTQMHRCPKCGQDVAHDETLGMYGDGPRFIRRMHTAPCGAECWGAGVSGKAYREKRLHGFDGNKADGNKAYPCPSCKPTAAEGG